MLQLLQLLNRPRLPFFGLALVGTGLLSFGLYLQHVQGLEPCPMCIMQRYAFAVAVLTGLIAALHGSTGGGRKAYGVLISLFALAGGGVAAWQSWLQLQPPNLAECGPGLEYMVESFPLSELLPMLFRGAGDCSAIDWTFLSLSIANWSLVCFVFTLAFGLHVIFRRVIAAR